MRHRIFRLLFSQVARGRFKIAAAALSGLIRIGGLSLFEFGDGRVAQTAADGFEVELDVLLERLVQNA